MIRKEVDLNPIQKIMHLTNYEKVSAKEVN